ncbi:MAG: hypothetical protein Sv326_1016 [Candidatus Fermentimicrarchaeum limneticum]|uniref:Uncharacterized protein n=1 Tax=Fermentimicrarchaeum limneticum TaxID=2795018 RepID=A0A7D5XDB4_FERL1|nr:MAG: hypothetical protein Sv326_1016 [Candidatus Fermentimicrarchaeum limneticum]
MKRGMFTLRCDDGFLGGTVRGEIMLLEDGDIQFVPPKERFVKMMLK